ncbi:MAG: hypothetical protein JNM83_11085 [Myxococcales bacterium]|nr:hypothetical protein [Myxococcales bacterium]
MAKRDEQDDLEGKSAVDFGPEERDGYRRTRRQVARGDKPIPEASEDEAPVPKTAYQRFMDDHWEAWLGPVLLLALAGALIVGYRADYIRESMLGMLFAGGLVAMSIYSTAVPAYDLIPSKNGRYAFAALCILWAAAAGYPTLRKSMARTVYGQAVLTEQSKSEKVQLPEGKTGPFDVTVSGTLKTEGAQNSNAVFEVQVAGEGGTETLSGEFSVRTNQMRVRQGTSSWTEQSNQIEHRLPRSLRGNTLTFTVEHIDDLLADGLHVSVHPQSYDPKWFFLLGILVVLGMIYVEGKIGDAKTKTHLIMASASTMVFAFHFHEHATASRMVKPALDSLILAVLTGGIGGTLVGAVVRRASGRDKIKAKDDDEKKSKDSEE